MSLSRWDTDVHRSTRAASKNIPASAGLTQEKAMLVLERLCLDGYTAHVMFSQEPSPVNQRISEGFVCVRCCGFKQPWRDQVHPAESVS